MTIKVYEAGFEQALQKQQTVIESLESAYNELQTSFDHLAETWIGTGGHHFKELAQEIRSQTLAGILMATVLNKQTKTGFQSFDTTDKNLSKSLIP